MKFITDIFTQPSVAHDILIFGLVISFGLILGSIGIFRIQLGVAGVLFAGIAFGYFHLNVTPEILHFVRDFGLILFVYAIGLQVGPGFLNAFKRNGIKLNILAVLEVGLGVLITILISFFVKIPIPMAVGMLSGAVTNTPSLAAGQQILRDLHPENAELAAMPALGYALGYPFGVIGLILVIIFMRLIFRMNMTDELKAQETHHGERKQLMSMDILVENKNVHGLALKDISIFKKYDVIISRLYHEGHLEVALSETIISLGDILRVVGTKEDLDALLLFLGKKAQIDLRGLKNKIIARQIVVTKKDMDGRTISEIDPLGRYGVTITRIIRSDLEMPANLNFEVRYADTLFVVGEESLINQFAKDVGNSPRDLDHPFIVPVFVGIVLGILLGSIPIYLPGISAPVKLGLAGGPLIVAIILSAVGRVGNLIWYMPRSANYILREIGIVLFLACVGLMSGENFVKSISTMQGLYWVLAAACITVIPVLTVGIIARVFFKYDYFTLAGLISGCRTNPPALAYINNILTTPHYASVSYATVYPLVMILRILSAQLIVILFV